MIYKVFGVFAPCYCSDVYDFMVFCDLVVLAVVSIESMFDTHEIFLSL